MERDVNKNTKNYTSMLAFFIVILIVSLIWVKNEFNILHKKQSPLFLYMNSFQKLEKEWVRPTHLGFEKKSPEEIFFDGMEAFVAKNYDKAESLFHKALTLVKTDPALPIYAYYYINQCSVAKTGRGHFTAVANALGFMENYPPLANDVDFIRDLISSITYNSEGYRYTVKILDIYLDRTDTLDLYSRSWIMNAIALFEYNLGNYASSIRRFYDVDILLEKQELTPELRYEHFFAREYIATLLMLFENYKEAAILYQNLVKTATKKEETYQYSSLLNLVEAYINLGEFDNARYNLDFLQGFISNLEEDIQDEIVACANTMRAKLLIKENKYEEANIFLDRTTDYYAQNTGRIFLEVAQQNQIIRADLLFQTNKPYESQEILEKLLAENKNISYATKKDAYELLDKIYRETGQQTALIDNYHNLLVLDKTFSDTIKKEYIDFSKYYKESSILQAYNAQLRQDNLVAILGIIIISCSLFIISVFLKLLSTKNLTDQLTGINNRKKLNQLLRVYKTKGTPELFGVVMLDIDYFKQYNDSNGHVAGDIVLKKVAKMLTNSIRSNDYVIRYGGEEFLLLLNKVTVSSAESICQRIHQQLERLAIPHSTSQVSDKVTVSMGLCHQTLPNLAPLAKLLEEADQCLYHSKKSGRNQTTTKEWIEEEKPDESIPMIKI